MPSILIFSLKQLAINPFSSSEWWGGLTLWLLPAAFQSVLDLSKCFWNWWNPSSVLQETDPVVVTHAGIFQGSIYEDGGSRIPALPSDLEAQPASVLRDTLFWGRRNLPKSTTVKSYPVSSSLLQWRSAKEQIQSNCQMLDFICCSLIWEVFEVLGRFFWQVIVQYKLFDLGSEALL